MAQSAAVSTQMKLFGAQDEAELFHDAKRSGFFSLLVSWGDDDKRQSSHLLTELPTVLSLADPNRDTWLTQAEFMRPNRRVVNLLRLGLLFVDIDSYKMPWAEGKSPQAQVAALVHFCQAEGIPEPSLVVFSGRGLQAKWLLDGTIPRQALPRWNACQRHLVDRLAPLGADPAAKDASRVLRLVNTVNSKSGEICRVVHVKEQGGQPVRYGFEFMAEALLPVARWDIERQRQARETRRALKSIDGGKTRGLRGFSGRQLAWDRLEDLRRLADLRGRVTEGERMKHLFWRLNFLLLSGATNSAQMYHEAVALAQEIDPHWSYRSKELMTLYSKAKAHEAGEKVEFGGKEYAPLYTPKNDTLINLFQISEDEQRELRTLISSDIAKERDRARDTARRRAAGAVDRETYESRSLSRQKPWEALGMSRASWYRAGKPTALGSETGSSVLQAEDGNPTNLSVGHDAGINTRETSASVLLMAEPPLF
jgi:ElaB/YqjD/DUF883 family membrane-anchored ribosome-binding protein